VKTRAARSTATTGERHRGWWPASRERQQIVVGAICWILALEYFIAQLIAQTAWPSYRMSDYDVSALGVTTCGPFIDSITHESLGYMCSPLHAVMNTGFLLLGVLIMLGAFLTRSMWPRRRLTTFGLIFVSLGGLGEMFAGLAPGDVNVPMHAAGALLHWVGGGIGIMLLGFALWKTQRLLAVFSLLVGAIGFLGFFLYGNQVYFGLGRGIMQRVLAYPATIWLIVLGLTMLASALSGGSKPAGAMPAST
jgi:hypothetical membrane protein